LSNPFNTVPLAGIGGGRRSPRASARGSHHEPTAGIGGGRRSPRASARGSHREPTAEAVGNIHRRATELPDKRGG